MRRCIAESVYAGQRLRVNMENGEIRKEQIAEGDVQMWLLGSGLAAHLLCEGLDPSLDPLDPANPLLVPNGLLTGTFAPAAARTSWCGRSPLPGIGNGSNLGGHWRAELLFTSFDGLVVTVCSSPVVRGKTLSAGSSS